MISISQVYYHFAAPCRRDVLPLRKGTRFRTHLAGILPFRSSLPARRPAAAKRHPLSYF